MSDPIYALPAVAAYAADVGVATLRQWARRGHISPPVDGCYDLNEIAAYTEKREAEGNVGRAIGGRRRRGERRSP